MSASPPASAAPAPAWQRALPWAVAGIFGVALISSLLTWAPWRAAPVPTPRKLLASIGADASLPTDAGRVGDSVAGRDDARVRRAAGGPDAALHPQARSNLQAAALTGTEGAANPFFSPDGQWIAFFAGGKLKKISTTGGAPVNLCDARAGRGGTWTDDDTIIFTPASASTPRSCASRRPAEHRPSSARSAKARRRSGGRRRSPAARRCSTRSVRGVVDGYRDGANLVVAPLTGGAPKIVVRGGYYGRYVPSGLASPKRAEREGGHLVYMKQGTLFAVRFDRDRLETIGQAVPALEGVAADRHAAVRNWPCRRRARSCTCPARPRRPQTRSTG